MNGSKSRIIAIHLLNDYSGSPLVFSQALSGLQAAGHEVIIHTSRGRDGFLLKPGLPIVYFPYAFFPNVMFRLIAFFYSQAYLFFQLQRYRKDDVIIYINTLLPFGAALAGAWMKKKVVYHVHESYIRPVFFKKFLKFIAAKTADSVLYVSHYLHREENIAGVPGQVVYNALPDEFVQQAGTHRYFPFSGSEFTVLMVCSLKEYKGIPEFIKLARRHAHFRFELVLNASSSEIHAYFSKTDLPVNLHLFPVQTNLDAFYRRASLVVNLTNPSLCIETFGMTLLEAMCYGVPVIAPPLGGPAELVQSAFNGYAIDVRDEATLDFRLEYLAANPEMMDKLSEGARKTARRFRADAFRREVVSGIHS